MKLAKPYAPKAAIFASGGLHPIEQAAALDDGADMVAIGRWALANLDLPRHWSDLGVLAGFDPTILAPIADIWPDRQYQGRRAGAVTAARSPWRSRRPTASGPVAPVGAES